MGIVQKDLAAGEYIRRIQDFSGPLGLHIESFYGNDLIAEHIETHRFFHARGKDVHDRTPDAELSDVVNERFPGVAHTDEPEGKILPFYLRARLEAYDTRDKISLSYGEAENGLQRGDHH